ncbi:aminopeptidase N [Paraferrimonas haliotis]|uniref:Aminopeptidase N n=1 Tax=Paraferrimonas haliotis TaxID=2013866 RepID=A0AA37TMV8_9GAMM|nr:aminopeptidase N [Paraferrimonas haliotis]GLS84629.1 aminopeptidase N [Paraferrimonas haliotis]
MSQPQARYLKDYQSPDFTINHVDLDFQLDPNKTRVVAKSQIKRLRKDAKVVKLDGEDLSLVSVFVNENEVTHQVITREGGIDINVDLDEFELTIVTHIDPQNNSKLEGLYVSDGAYCTQCEAEGFRRITYFLDRPDVLSTYRVRIEAPQSFPYLLSNGNPLEQGSLDNDRHYALWHDPYPKPSYLFALVAGDFDLLQDEYQTKSGRKVDLQVFVDKGNLHKAEHAMTSLKKSMQWDEQRFNLEYDLDIYMIVAVDFFNMGAMENKGLNLFNTKYVLADKASATDNDFDGIESVIGHEYFHNWTGNRVTCRDWFQLSLKEGLTVFRDQEFSSDLGSRTVNRIAAVKAMRTVQFAEDAGPMAHPIRPESVIEMNNFYTVTVYNKGAEVIRMMHTLLGEAGFQQGMALYFERHDGQAVTCDDFVAAMSDANNFDFSQFKRWYSQAGTPIVRLQEAYDDKRQSYRLTLEQATPYTADGSAKLPFHIPVDMELLDRQGNSLVTEVLNFTQEKQQWTFEGIAEKPIVSLFREFSAPVKLDYQYSQDDLVHLLKHASNEFSRWDASQALVSSSILANVKRLSKGESCQSSPQLWEALQSVLQTQALDPAFIAELMTPPTFASLMDECEPVLVDELITARQYHIDTLAKQLATELDERYHACLQQTNLSGGEAVANRALKNTCLYYLGVLTDKQELVVNQYQQADNMTDSLAALHTANEHQLHQRQQLMIDFEQKWLQTPLVMDKWFTLQGKNPNKDMLASFDALLEHSAFALANPNRVYSLIGSFANANPKHFHKLDGSGYRFLTDLLIKLNDVNPQVAARLITPLIQWQRLDETRQQLMKAELKRLQSLPNLAKDLFEKVSKSLA